MNYQQRNRALSECLRERYERTTEDLKAACWHDVDFIFYPLFQIRALFCRYAPLGMSLHDSVADDSCSDRIHKAHRPLN